jgi:predicted small secreted protein
VSNEALFAGIGAVIAAAMGVTLILREFHRREHNAARKEVDEMVVDFYRLDNSYIDLRLHCFRLRQRLADLGEESLPGPEPALHEPMHREKRLS